MVETILLQLSVFAETLSISVAEIFLFLSILAAAFTLYKEKDFSIFKKSFTMFFGLMILAETLSTFFGYDPKRSIKSWPEFWVMFYLFTTYILYDGKNREKIMLAFFAGCLVTVVYSAYKFPTAYMHRVKGFYSHSLTYGNVIAMMFVAAVGLSIFTPPNNKKIRYIFYFSAVICALGLLMSGSRGPMVSAFVAILAMVIYRYRTKGLAIAVAIIIAVAIGVFASPLKNRFHQVDTDLEAGSYSSVGTRLVLWEATSKAIMAKPLFGYGRGNFKPVVSKYIHVPVMSMAHAHNSYLQFTFLHGFVGLATLLLFLSALFRHIMRDMKTNPYARTALFIFITYMLEGLTENNFNDSEVVMAAYTVIALLITPVREKGYYLFRKG